MRWGAVRNILMGRPCEADHGNVIARNCRNNIPKRHHLNNVAKTAQCGDRRTVYSARPVRDAALTK